MRGLIGWIRRRWYGPTCVSERWLQANAQRESQAGVDLPRWRTPKEREALVRLARKHLIAMARDDQRQRRRA